MWELILYIINNKTKKICEFYYTYYYNYIKVQYYTRYCIKKFYGKNHLHI